MLPASLIAVLELSLLLLLGKLGEEGFSALDLTPFVGAILIGLLIGPGIFKVFYPSPYISDFTNLGIVFILFMAGVEETRGGSEIRRPALAGIINFITEYVILYTLLTYLGFEPLTSSILAISLGMVSAGLFPELYKKYRLKMIQVSTENFLLRFFLTKSRQSYFFLFLPSTPSKTRWLC